MTTVRHFRVFAALLAAASCLPDIAGAKSPPKSEATPDHDGVYAVDVVTQQGVCDRSYRWTIAVSGGRVRSVGDAQMQASGQIARNGAVSLAFRRDNQVAHVSGRVQGNTGSGAWSSPTMQCGGYWRATRVG
jgi:hypothetical protein